MKKALPALGALRNEAGSAGLTNAILNLEVLGFETQVEFNFKDEIL